MNFTNICLKILSGIFAISSLLILQACSTTEVVDRAHPYSDIQEGFMTQDSRTFRPSKHNPNSYFYKHCDQEMGDAHYSKTSYSCNER